MTNLEKLISTLDEAQNSDTTQDENGFAAFELVQFFITMSTLTGFLARFTLNVEVPVLERAVEKEISSSPKFNPQLWDIYIILRGDDIFRRAILGRELEAFLKWWLQRPVIEGQGLEQGWNEMDKVFKEFDIFQDEKRN